jgi:hypothetical protein
MRSSAQRSLEPRGLLTLFGAILKNHFLGIHSHTSLKLLTKYPVEPTYADRRSRSMIEDRVLQLPGGLSRLFGRKATLENCDL